jgi:predicted phosphodiesterase
MKVTVIGDIHGRDTWKDIVEKNPDSHFIFTGDYTDPYAVEMIDEEESIDNFHDILNFKLEEPNKVHLLIGNHDAQYLYYPNYGTAVRSIKFLSKLKQIYQDNSSLFQFAIQKDKYLFTHAGITNSWFNEYYKLLEYFGLNADMSNIAVIINKIGKTSKWRDVLFTVSYLRSGFDPYGGPLWADRREVFSDFLSGFQQFAGHNKVQGVIKIGNSKSSITLCDCLWHTEESITINI